VIAQYQFLTGTGIFDNATASASFVNPQCVQLGTPAQTASATALSVTVAITQLCGSGGGGLSIGAIVGIAIGCGKKFTKK
jgi:hypothetical protein